MLKKRRCAKWLTMLLALHIAACGTLIHPERRNQPAGRLDPGIVVLDAVGLLLFFIPGVIAFAVDFSNGTIYLPPEHTSLSPSSESKNLRTVRVNPADLTPQRLEAIIGEQTGQTVRLQPGSYRATKLGQIQDLTPSAFANIQNSPAATVIFRGKAE